MFQPILCLSSLNELVGQVLRSQQSEMGLLEQLVWKRRIWFIFSSIIMYKSPTTFMKRCTKVKSHKWICDVILVRHVGRKREKKDAKAIRPKELKKEILVEAKSKLSGLHLLWLDMKSVKGTKEGKDEEINREAAVKMDWRSEVPGGEDVKPQRKREKPQQVRLRTKVQSGRTAWVRASKREEKNREGKRKYIVRKRAVSEKKKRGFLYLNCISKCHNIYLI